MSILKHIQTEVDASYLYGILAQTEDNPQVADVFKQMSEIEKSHAVAFMEKHSIPLSQMPKPSLRAKILKGIGKRLGNDILLGVLLDTEKSLSSSILNIRKKSNLATSVSDTSHVTVIRNLLDTKKSINSSVWVRFESRHRSVGGNALRAAVLGGNDGLVSNFSLVMGIAGASSGQTEVLLAGLAGLLAGALSMALGEWISVKSSQELYENQMDLEMEELETHPEGEQKELTLIFQSKGISPEESARLAAELMLDKSKAHEMLVKEELGINSDELKGSAMEAALSSFLLFAIGAIIPVFPFFFLGGTTAVFLSIGMSAIGLFLIGAAITLFTGKPILFSGMRQVFFGLSAAAITYGIGSLIGISIAG
ncbi:MAG: rubrerythrin family protein [Sphingobacteriia bacterium]|nr:rubrerythrin family protein [Sphingobacteriia bacterium]